MSKTKKTPLPLALQITCVTRKVTSRLLPFVLLHNSRFRMTISIPSIRRHVMVSLIGLVTLGQTDSFPSRASSIQRQLPKKCEVPSFQALPKRQCVLALLLVPTAKTNSMDTGTTQNGPSTIPEALQLFFLGPEKGPIAIVGLLALIFLWRVQLSEFSVLDPFLVIAAIMFWWIQEHVLHEKVLHSNTEWIGKQIHRSHHENPYFHISIDPAPLMIGWMIGAHVALRCVLPIPLALSATLGYACAGLVYEWAHFIVHTRVKPPNNYWRRVRDNHIKHHLVDDQYWFSFTVPAMDTLFGTNPSMHEVKRKQVPLKTSERKPREFQPLS